jgi:dTDP-L-rhamnose 4-epimerase
MEKVLVTGGAGFIGSWTVDFLLEKGYEVRILDNLQLRVHPLGKPEWISKDAEFIKGSVCNSYELGQALKGIDYVIHLAAYQDYMLDFSTFIRTNAESTALLFELIISNQKRYPIRKIIFASSQAVCGEGWYICPKCTDSTKLKIINSEQNNRVHKYNLLFPDKSIIIPKARSVEQLNRGKWEVCCEICGEELLPILIGEEAVSPSTAYGISKYTTEMLANCLGRRYNIPVACMRYTYVQGLRNSLYNAYSGIARRFALCLFNNLQPSIYEDGKQLRDYINVRDVAKANILVMEDDRANFGIFNVGGGKAITVLEFARMMLNVFQSKLEPKITGEYRLGDTRHTVSDISHIQSLGWEPTISVEQSVFEYVESVKEQKVPSKYLDDAEYFMKSHGIVRKIE